MTGNALPVALELFDKYELPLPEFFIGNVGTSIFKRNDSGLHVQPYDEDQDFLEHIVDQSEGWNTQEFRKTLGSLAGLLEQEDWRNNNLKLSYYTSPEELEILGKEVKRRVDQICSECTVVTSTHGSFENGTARGFLDILPKRATKAGALRFLMEKMRISNEEVVFSGDSGNDLDCLSAEWRSTLVRNATPEIRDALSQSDLSRVHFAEGLGSLNGYSSEGVIEGLIVHGFMNEEYAK